MCVDPDLQASDPEYYLIRNIPFFRGDVRNTHNYSQMIRIEYSLEVYFIGKDAKGYDF